MENSNFGGKAQILAENLDFGGKTEKRRFSHCVLEGITESPSKNLLTLHSMDMATLRVNADACIILAGMRILLPPTPRPSTNWNTVRSVFNLRLCYNNNFKHLRSAVTK